MHATIWIFRRVPIYLRHTLRLSPFYPPFYPPGPYDLFSPPQVHQRRSVTRFRFIRASIDLNSTRSSIEVVRAKEAAEKRSNRERRPYPLWLKPVIVTVTYGRPEGRPLQRTWFFRACKAYIPSLFVGNEFFSNLLGARRKVHRCFGSPLPFNARRWRPTVNGYHATGIPPILRFSTAEEWAS